jgi:HlyD family secretion protein
LRDQSLLAEEAYDVAAANAEQALQAYEELRRGSRSEDEREAAAVLAQAEEGRAYLQDQRRESVVRSPAAGVIQTFDLRPGDLVAANQPVASILPVGNLWVRVYVPENEIGSVRIGQGAALSVDSFPERHFDAQVVAVRDRAEYTPRNVQTADQRRDRVFAVKLVVSQAPELKPGTTATVRFQ